MGEITVGRAHPVDVANDLDRMSERLHAIANALNDNFDEAIAALPTGEDSGPLFRVLVDAVRAEARDLADRSAELVPRKDRVA